MNTATRETIRETVQQGIAQERTLHEFAEQLESNLTATIGETTWTISGERERWQFDRTTPNGETETIVQGIYNFAFSSLLRTIGYCVSDARGRLKAGTI